VRRGHALDIFAFGTIHRLELDVPDAGDHEDEAGSLAAPMPGSVVEVLVKPGDVVAKGATLMIIEAMKMEHTIVAPVAGTVKEVFFAKGDQVGEGVNLIGFEVNP